MRVALVMWLSDGSFFSLLQKNVLDSQRWCTRAGLRLAIVTWIEKTYHRKRRPRRLGRWVGRFR